MSHRSPDSSGALVAEIRRFVVAHEQAIEEVFERHELDAEQRGVVLADLMLLFTLRWKRIPDQAREESFFSELERMAVRVVEEDEEDEEEDGPAATGD